MILMLFAAVTARPGSLAQNPLLLPDVGSSELRVLTPTLLELSLVTTKDPDPARVAQWDFVTTNAQLNLPPVSEFVVTADGRSVRVNSIGFRRRPLYAPLKQRDLRIGNFLYMQLAKPIVDGQVVVVSNPSALLWSTNTEFRTQMDPYRLSPALHVNQHGYVPSATKRAMIGYYLGSLGELDAGTTPSFVLVDAATTNIVHQGTCQPRLDIGYNFTPAPYQKVLEADFSSFTNAGNYKLFVSGMGVSFPFSIHEGVNAAFARTYALGIYHQRCGTSNSLPFTRFIHDACHTNLAEIPTLAFSAVNAALLNFSLEGMDPAQTAPALANVAASLFPFTSTNRVDVSGGHHDAGDYSKYTINSAAFIHSLVFAADNFPGVAALDNLGLPESGDGVSDLLQEAKWEADFLVKMQDRDGGFYFLVYPRDREYEWDVLPDHGDPQVVFPKNTSATAAAVAALAQIASSPAFKASFPLDASNYLAKARLGWAFLQTAFAVYGRDGAYQRVTHYGDEFVHNDELAWAATELFLATGEPAFQTDLLAHFDPSDPNTRVYGWWRMFEGYGCAIRSYAFAERSGRLPRNLMDTNFLAKCEAELLAAADDQVRFANENAYASSFPDPSKAFATAGWYFSVEQVFDVAAAYQLNPRREYLDCLTGNLNYEAGCNPLNVCFITGLGWKRQREIVHQYAQNDRRVLPPSGLPLGNLQTGFTQVPNYGGELGALCFPPDRPTSAPYAPYDRWGDTFNTTTEFVNVQQARSLGVTAFLMARTSYQTQAWQSASAQIVGGTNQIAQGQTNLVSLTADPLDLTGAQIVWETPNQEPFIGVQFSLAPVTIGPQWLEAEALLVDGRRLFASVIFTATIATNTPPNVYRSSSWPVAPDMIALYHFDNNFNEATGTGPPMIAGGNARFDSQNLAWMTTPAGGAIRVLDLNDQVTVTLNNVAINPDTQALMIEAMFYVNAFKAYNRSNAVILSLYKDFNASLELIEDAYAGVLFRGGTTFELNAQLSTPALTRNQWHHVRIALDRRGYLVRVDGKIIATLSSGEAKNWAGGGTVTVTAGNFDGWLDDLAVRVVETLQVTASSQITGPQLQVIGNANQQFILDTSNNLSQWIPILTNALAITPLDVSNVISPTNSFYRARNLSRQFEY